MGFRQDRRGAWTARPAISTLLLLCCGAAHAQSRYASTVRARPADAPAEDDVADASVVTDARTPRAGESVAQLLSELPGVTLRRTGGIGALAMLSLRGSTWDQVGVYLDGVPLNAAQGGGVDLSTLPLGDVERIEVYRGATPIGFGSSALGGIVSITTRAPRSTRVDGELGAGSFDTYGAGVSGSFAGRRLRLYTGAHYLASAGDFWFTSDNGTAFDTRHDHEVRRANDAVTQVDGSARAIFAIDGGRNLSAFALVFFRDQGLPGYGSIRQTSRTKLQTLRFLASSAYDSRRDLGPGGRLHAQLYAMLERQRFADPLGEIAIAPADTDDRTRTLGFNVHLSRPLLRWLRGAAVAEGRDQLFSPRDGDGRPPTGAPATRLFGSVGVEADAAWQRLKLHVVPSLRLEVARDERSGRNLFAQLVGKSAPVTNVVPAARLALCERLPGDVTVRANAGRYSRLPSLSELYGDSGFILGNPDLVPESGWNVDAGAAWQGAHGRLAAAASVTGFASLAENLIQFQQDAYGRARALNVGRARILGVEATLDLRAGDWAHLVANATYTDGRDVSATSLGRRQPLLPNRPTFHVYTRPEGRWPLARGVTLGAYVDLDVIDGNYLDPANLVALPTRFLVGAGLYAEATRAHLMVVASAQNLGDVRSFDFAGFPLPSRSLFVSARLSLPRDLLKENAP